MHGLLRRDVGVAHPRVESGEVVIEQPLVELQFQIAGGPGGAVVRQADLAADADVQAEAAWGSSPGERTRWMR